MYIFDTRVQYIKYLTLRQVARHAWKGDLSESIFDIPAEIMANDNIDTDNRYRDLAILTQRVKIATGNRRHTHIMETIGLACDECPAEGYAVTDFCRGCLAHRCRDVCPKDAITADQHQRSVIDKSKCINCGKCAQVCPYSAIINRKRPCQVACKVDAILMNDDGTVRIDHSKCIACGACTYRCPFGAIADKSHIIDVVELLKTPHAEICAIVAPAIASQFTYAKTGQIISALKSLGFTHIIEAAFGADMVAYNEAVELSEKGFLTSSCCPAFVYHVKKRFPELEDNVSTNLSPMAATGKYMKEKYPGIKTVFIGPCTAKKAEALFPWSSKYVDNVLTFEELQALIDSRDIDPCTLPESKLEDASCYGRIFAHCGGLSEAATEALKEQGIDFAIKPVSCSGIDECHTALLKASKGKLDGNFIEGMACDGGCVGGAGCLTHMPKNRVLVDLYSKQSVSKSIGESISGLTVDIEEAIGDINCD